MKKIATLTGILSLSLLGCVTPKAEYARSYRSGNLPTGQHVSLEEVRNQRGIPVTTTLRGEYVTYQLIDWNEDGTPDNAREFREFSKNNYTSENQKFNKIKNYIAYVRNHLKD